MTRYPDDALLLVDCLINPKRAVDLSDADWMALISMARAERLIATLAEKLADQKLPQARYDVVEDERIDLEYQHRAALWEVDCARRAIESYAGPVILMKGSAYVVAGYTASRGRLVGDLDIMVRENDLKEVEALLLQAGWEWVKEDAYDDSYYRDHMHELPPLIHKDRDGMIDVHHTILPRTARPTPDAKSMIDCAVRLDSGLYIFCPEDIICHSAAHLMADGDLAGGLRNLWDIHCLLSEFSDADTGFWQKLKARAEHHQLWAAVDWSARHAHALYGTAIPKDWMRWNFADRSIQKRILARNGWGQETQKMLRLIFYIRSHWLRMPPFMLAKHLWTKWRKNSKTASPG